jgi:hypothetical protein
MNTDEIHMLHEHYPESAIMTGWKIMAEVDESPLSVGSRWVIRI